MFNVQALTLSYKQLASNEVDKALRPCTLQPNSSLLLFTLRPVFFSDLIALNVALPFLQ